MSEVPSRRGFQFSLRSVLFLGVPWAAALAWIISLDGPYFDNRRVCTHKLGLIILLFNAGFILVMFGGWMRTSRRFLAAWLIVFAILAVSILRNRQESIERQRQQSMPAAPANSRALPPR